MPKENFALFRSNDEMRYVESQNNSQALHYVSLRLSFLASEASGALRFFAQAFPGRKAA
jgi:hypothetical protein